MNLKNALSNESNWTQTENDADALKSTQNSLVDLFGVIGALRTRTGDVENLFIKAFYENKLLATKMSFYARNVRGGLGERSVSKIIWKYLANNYSDIMIKNINIIPLFGRWDDLYEFVGTPVEKYMWELIRNQLKEDLENFTSGNSISLLAKWMKSINASSTETNRLGKLTAKNLGYSEQEYRKMLKTLRDHINIVESKMSNNQWSEIDYRSVPSKAMMNYRKSFSKHDLERFGKFIEKVETGEEKINSSTLYPYDIFEKMGLAEKYGGRSQSFYFTSPDKVLEAQWKALPNYFVDGDVLVMADTSGSMQGRPIAISLGLAVYCAEHNSGQFKDSFITFSSRPSFVKLVGNTLAEKIRNVPAIVENTNIESAFNLVLNAAKENKVSSEDMPKAIIIISDMEFDRCSGYRMTFYDAMKLKFENAGHKIPDILFWNVNSRQNVFHAFSEYKGVQLASGSSPSVFSSIIKNLGMNPYEAMLNVLNDEVYNVVVI